MFGNSRKEKFKTAINEDDADAVRQMMASDREYYSGLTYKRQAGHILFRENVSPLHYAAALGKIEVAKVLLDCGMDINAGHPRTHWTPLHCAADENRLEMIKFLLENGANKNVRTWAGNRPRDLACNEAGNLLKAFKKKTVPPEAVAVNYHQEEAVVDHRRGQWFLDTPEEVRFEKDTAGFHLTEVFNFETRERTSFWRNDPKTAPFSVERKSFDEIPDKASLETAFENLEGLGGKAERSSILAHNRRQKPLPPARE